MKILVISSKFPYPSKDGGALAIKAFSENLAKSGYEVDFVAVETPKHPASNIPQLQNINFHTVFKDTAIKGSQALSNFLFSKHPYIAERFFSEELKKKGKQLITENDYSFVVIEGLYVAYLIDFIKNLCDCLVVYRAHNVEYKIWERKTANEKNLLRKLFLKTMTNRLQKFERENINKADFILPITSEDEKIIKDEFGYSGQTYVMPFGIDYGSSNRDILSSGDYNSLAFIGSLDWLPNIEGLLWFVDNVWHKIHQQHGIKFYVAGRNAGVSFIKKMNSAKGVVFLGEVENAEEFILSHKIMVVPLFSGSGMRVKIIEAMNLGRVVISTPVGIEGIDAKNGKHYILANDADEWITIINDLLDNKSLIDDLSKNAMQLIAEKYINSKIVANAINSINEYKQKAVK